MTRYICSDLRLQIGSRKAGTNNELIIIDIMNLTDDFY